MVEMHILAEKKGRENPCSTNDDHLIKYLENPANLGVLLGCDERIRF